MATRKIKDAKDLDSNELIYFKGHAKATYLSNGATVEDSIGEVKSDLSTVIDSLEEISENSTSLKEITYSDLVNLVDTNSLIPGKCYRITDYVTTVAGLDLVKSANHPFDIIVTAISSNELSEDAKAILHEGDEYFAKCKLNSWELKYCLDNDTNRFTWADTENGKGVIWYMKDESDNSAYYDFKGVQVREKKDSNDWYYTFSVYYTDTQEDFSVAKYNYNGKGCINNIIDIQHLAYDKVTINYNTIIADARPTDGEIDVENYNWRSIYNHIGKNCSHIKINKAAMNNHFGSHCSYITFTYASNVTFGEQNKYIYFHSSDDTVFGPFVNNFKFIKEDGNYNYIHSSRIETNANGGYYINIKSVNELKNLHIKAGVADNKTQTIEIDECGNYTTTIERSASTGEVIISKSGDNKTSIILNEEYYDDGSGQLVPIKHPDLSTQPAVLPYKFMNQCVYEQLIPGNTGLFSIDSETTYYINKSQASLVIENPIIIEGSAISKNFAGTAYQTVTDENTLRFSFSSPLQDLPLYFKIIYTSMPEETGEN